MWNPKSRRTALLIIANVVFFGILLCPILVMMYEAATQEYASDGWPLESVD